MGAIPTTTNTAASDINIFISVINKTIETAAQAAIIAAVPELGAPVIKQIIDVIENAVESTITKYEQLGATFIVTDIQVGLEKDAVSHDVQAILNDEKSGDQNALERDEKQYQLDTSSLTHDDGSATPTG